MGAEMGEMGTGEYGSPSCEMDDAMTTRPTPATPAASSAVNVAWVLMLNTS